MTAAKTKPKTTPAIGDAAVKAATGKNWKQWFTLLDKAQAHALNHQEIVAWLVKNHGLPPWWRQMVTVTYEQARGLRRKHEKPDGFQISRSVTIGVPVAALYRAWAEVRRRSRWLDDPKFDIRSATPNKCLRLNWVDGKTTLEVNFSAKATGKSQVSVQHNKLATAAAAARAKTYWATQLQQLKAYLDATSAV